ncbi:hypothetical protein F9U64_10730 [Gracilibacillus oryzae]|uniref:Uncharacterized protein n=1 Tax=Gracilibacillus oryzae TaxID=1672701 RepID=A0A7C8GTT7_9BACI|nr:hypothetical protein [Gracilibacillus oryzae]KAB8135741.1 hypothetical protein F9U64_10730 [Gracilibacillus oryzae]
MLLIYILLFFISGYLFVLQLIKAIRGDDNHHQYGLVKHSAAIFFVLWSTFMVISFLAFTE